MLCLQSSWLLDQACVDAGLLPILSVECEDSDCVVVAGKRMLEAKNSEAESIVSIQSSRASVIAEPSRLLQQAMHAPRLPLGNRAQKAITLNIRIATKDKLPAGWVAAVRH